MDGVGCLQFDFHTDRDRLADDQRARRGQLLVLEQDVRRARRRRRRQAREPAPARPNAHKRLTAPTQDDPHKLRRLRRPTGPRRAASCRRKTTYCSAA